MLVKTINTGVLEIAYQEYGRAEGWPCLMGHGFPYDVHAYSQVALNRPGFAGGCLV